MIYLGVLQLNTGVLLKTEIDTSALCRVLRLKKERDCGHLRLCWNSHSF